MIKKPGRGWLMPGALFFALLAGTNTWAGDETVIIQGDVVTRIENLEVTFFWNPVCEPPDAHTRTYDVNFRVDTAYGLYGADLDNFPFKGVCAEAYALTVMRAINNAINAQSPIPPNAGAEGREIFTIGIEEEQEGEAGLIGAVGGEYFGQFAGWEPCKQPNCLLGVAVTEADQPLVYAELLAPGTGGETGTKVAVGLGPLDGDGYVEIVGVTGPGYTHDAWVRTGWSEYDDGPNGETRAAPCDVDGDGRDELVIGLGPGGNGYVRIMDDVSTQFTPLAWVQVDWPEYNEANGETWPACGDLDADGRDEIVLGLGAGGNGYATLLDDATTGYALLPGTPNGEGWIRVGWDKYNAGVSGGEVRPAVGNLDNDLQEELVLGLGNGGAGWVILFDDQATGFAPIFPTNAPAKSGAWMQITWNSYNVAYGEIWPLVCDLNGDGLGEVIMGVGNGGDGFGQIFDSATGFAQAINTPQAGGWLQLPWPEYNTAAGAIYPSCGNLDADPADELVLGLNTYAVDGGWLAVFDDLNTGLVGIKWVKIGWGPYNDVNGLGRPAILEDKTQ